MERQYPRWSAPSLTRHRAAIIALTTVFLGCSLYYIHDQFSSPSQSPKPASPILRRSNARRQRRRARSGSFRPIPEVRDQFGDIRYENARYVVDEPWGSTPIDLGFLRSTEASDEILARHLLRSNDGQVIRVPLTRRMPSVEDLQTIFTDNEEAIRFRRELEEAFLTFYFFRHLSPNLINPEQQEAMLHELAVDGSFSADAVVLILSHHQDHRLPQAIQSWSRVQNARAEESRNAGISLRSLTPTIHQTTPGVQTSEDQATATDDESEHSWRGDRETEDGHEAEKDGQSLLNLLYRIAEEQASKDGYVHRRVTCNACNSMPIRGIRYHCANCLDYDLCEQCEAMQIHPKTHVFYKIRIPAPFMRNPRQPEPVWYPGKPVAVNQSLAREVTARICKDTGFQVAEVEALWEQFRCLAATEWLDDPCNYQLAIDRQTFDKCFLPQTTLRPPPPNLIHDRMFAFYDYNNDGLIGFSEFMIGLSNLSRKKADHRQKRVFEGYDINGDGFVDRKDFLRMFRAYYALTKELTRDVIAGMEDDVVSDNAARDIVLGSQPISSAFTGTIPPGGHFRSGEGKFRDHYGDLTVFDDMRAIDENDRDFADLYDTMDNPTCREQLRHKWADEIRRVYIDPWPPATITAADVMKVTHQEDPPEQVTLLEDQKQIRRVTHARLAKSYQESSYAKSVTIRNREKRRAFSLDGEDGAMSARVSQINHATTVHQANLDLTQGNNFEKLMAIGRVGELKRFIRNKIEELDWPVYDSSSQLAAEILDMVHYDMTGMAIAEDLWGYTTVLAESKAFVASVFQALDAIVGRILPEIADQKRIENGQPTYRSRSSSKVRFQDDVGTEDGHESRSRATSISSRSIPLNERWGGFEVPEPEKDVGREVLYQVTQEAFNELLDPIFRVREDLAIAALRSKHMRDRFRTDSAASLGDPISVNEGLELYQKHWRRSPISDITPSDADSLGWDTSTMLRTFLKRRADGVLNRVTADPCPDCAKKKSHSWIPFGGFCSCGKSSDLRTPLSSAKASLPEGTCPRCAEKGEDSPIGGSVAGFSCSECGYTLELYTAERDRILGILSGGDPSPSEARSATVTDEHAVSTGYSSRTSGTSSASKAATSADIPLSVFGGLDPSTIESNITQKTLDELLADSGYRTATNPQQMPSTPPDPTLPQNRPNSLSQLPHILSNRPSDTGTKSPNKKTAKKTAKRAEKKEESKPDEDTLRYYAALTLLEHDDEQRGGPGRLNFEEFEEVMQGEKGKAFGFLGTWLEMASF